MESINVDSVVCRVVTYVTYVCLSSLEISANHGFFVFFFNVVFVIIHPGVQWDVAERKFKEKQDDFLNIGDYQYQSKNKKQQSFFSR